MCLMVDVLAIIPTIVKVLHIKSMAPLVIIMIIMYDYYSPLRLGEGYSRNPAKNKLNKRKFNEY